MTAGRRAMPSGRIRLVFMQIARDKWVTRQEVANATGVTARAVWDSAQDLIEMGFLVEKTEPRNSNRKLYRVASAWVGQ